MTPEASNNLDLVKARLGLTDALPSLRAARELEAGNARGSEADAKRWKAALQFEAMFLSQMYKAMRKTTLGEGNELTEASPGREIYTEMLDNQYASLGSRNPLTAGPQGLKNAMAGISNSLAAQIYRSLRRAEGAAAGGPSDPAAAAAPAGRGAAGTTPLPRYLDESGTASEDDFPVEPHLARIVGAHARDGRPTSAPALGEAALGPLVDEASASYGVPANLIRSVIRAESAGRPLAVSSAGAKGLMQLMDTTARDLGVRNPFDARENVMAGTRYLRGLLDRYAGDETKALAAYNAGPGTVDRFGGVPPYAETRAYVDTVLTAKRALDGAEGK